MGEVWRARHRLLARPAAIKLIRPAMLAGGTDADARATVRRFEHEAQATAALTSPHTIRLFDFGVTDEGSFYYVMELLDGRDMASLVAEFGPLPPARVIYLLQQVCHSLAEAHSRGLVHRDVKPANIFVCRMGLEHDFVKVLDFGLVQVTGPNPAHDLTQSLAALEGVVGTPAFMAPEMIVGHRQVDHRADIYALGCVAYFLLTGQQVFQGGTQMQALIDHVSTAPPPPSARAAQPFRVRSMRWSWRASRRIRRAGRPTRWRCRSASRSATARANGRTSRRRCGGRRICRRSKPTRHRSTTRRRGRNRPMASWPASLLCASPATGGCSSPRDSSGCSPTDCCRSCWCSTSSGWA